MICGLDWVMQHRDTIDVVNLSLTTADSNAPCTRSTNASTWTSPLHEAICRVYDAGIPIAAAAGNLGIDASTVAPANYDEVISVSAFVDTDGKPGGLGAACNGAADDTFASYSNYGSDVDIMAPGSCIRSTGVGGGTTTKSGTSMATGYVTGAIALYKSQNPKASPADVKAWLLSTAIAQDSANGLIASGRGPSSEPLLYIGAPLIPPATQTATVTIRGNYKLVTSDKSANSAASTYVRDGKLSTYLVHQGGQVQSNVRLRLGLTRWGGLDRVYPLGVRQDRLGRPVLD